MKKNKHPKRKRHQLIHRIKLLHSRMNLSLLMRSSEEIQRAAAGNTYYISGSVPKGFKSRAPHQLRVTTCEACKNTLARYGATA